MAQTELLRDTRRIMTMRKFSYFVAALAAAGVLLAGCSSSSTRKPVDLTQIDQKLRVSQAWSLSVGKGGNYAFRPAAAGSEVIVASADGQLARVNAKTGAVAWQIKAAEDISSGPGSDGITTVVATIKGKVLAFDSAGKPLWNASVPGEVLTPPLLVNQLALVRTLDSRIFAFDAATGAARWTFQRPQASLSLRTAFGMLPTNGAVVTGFPGGKIGVLNPNNGAMIWESTLTLARGVSEIERLIDVSGMPAVRDKTICAAAFQGRIGCLDLPSGNNIWTKEFSSAAGVEMDDKGVYGVNEKSVVTAFALANGTQLWRNDKLHYRSLGAPLLVGKTLVAGDYQGVVHFFSVDDGAIVGRISTESTPITAAPLLVGDTVVVQNRGGRVYGLVPGK